MTALSDKEQQLLVEYIEVHSKLMNLVAFALNELAEEEQQETLERLQYIHQLLKE